VEERSADVQTDVQASKERDGSANSITEPGDAAMAETAVTVP